MRKAILSFAFIVATVTACSTTSNYQRKSAGFVGCMPDDVQVPDAPDFAMMPVSWTAICKNQRYVCTESLAGGPGMATNIHCSPAK